MSSVGACPVCESSTLVCFYEQSSVPTNSCILLPTRADALRCDRGDIRLSFCDGCGFIWNLAFDASKTEYTQQYEETQGFSPTFQKFHEALARELIERHNVRKKRVLEIGCGKGEFLLLLNQLGNNDCVGFDPGFKADRIVSRPTSGWRVIEDFYSDQYSEVKADFICCKMTLEHIPAPNSLLKAIENAVDEDAGTVLFCQVPDALRILQDCSFEDIYYEHCSYFTRNSLAELFRRHGFYPTRLASEYESQYLTIEAKWSREPGCGVQPESLDQVRSYIDNFASSCQRKIEGWNNRLGRLGEEQKKVALWGSGSKAVAFLRALGNTTAIQYVVDINPYRQGYYMGGTGHEIVSPEFLREFRPDTVIVMNRVYVDEIEENLQAMGIGATEVVAL